MLDCLQSNIDSGATPIRSAGRTPAEINHDARRITHVFTNLKIISHGVLIETSQINVFEDPASSRSRGSCGRDHLRSRANCFYLMSRVDSIFTPVFRQRRRSQASGSAILTTLFKYRVSSRSNQGNGRIASRSFLGSLSSNQPGKRKTNDKNLLMQKKTTS